MGREPEVGDGRTWGKIRSRIDSGEITYYYCSLEKYLPFLLFSYLLTFQDRSFWGRTVVTSYKGDSSDL